MPRPRGHPERGLPRRREDFERGSTVGGDEVTRWVKGLLELTTYQAIAMLLVSQPSEQLFV